MADFPLLFTEAKYWRREPVAQNAGILEYCIPRTPTILEQSKIPADNSGKL